MTTDEVEEAARAIQKLSLLRVLRADLITEKYQLRLYANKRGEDTMHHEVSVEDRDFAREIVSTIQERLENRLTALGVKL